MKRLQALGLVACSYDLIKQLVAAHLSSSFFFYESSLLSHSRAGGAEIEGEIYRFGGVGCMSAKEFGQTALSTSISECMYLNIFENPIRPLLVSQW
jgi:hypothetical protein